MLRQLIREITVIVLMAGLFEMLLPDNQLKRFVKLVLGLFVIVTLLGPISYWVKDENWGLSSWKLQSSDSQAATTVMSPGTGTQPGGGVSSSYQKHLARQIESMLQLVPGVERVEAKVYLREGASFYSLDAISQVEVRVTRDKSQDAYGSQPGTGTDGSKALVKPIPRVEISTDGKPADSGAGIDTGAVEMTQRVKETVSNFYGLPKERIQVEVV